jgi:major type 1 subunit fimbrin (pilin)
MSKRLLSTALLATLGLAFVPGAQAVDGTITFNGAVTDLTCTVTVNGTSGSTVTLPTVSQSALAGAGAVAGQTPFNIALSGCSTSMTKAATYFEAGPDVTADGRLVNTAGVAKADNVEVELAYSDDSQVVVGQAAPTSGPGVATVSAGAATLNYYARYYATDVAGSGAVSSTVQFSMIYN